MEYLEDYLNIYDRIDKAYNMKEINLLRQSINKYLEKHQYKRNFIFFTRVNQDAVDCYHKLLDRFLNKKAILLQEHIDEIKHK